MAARRGWGEDSIYWDSSRNRYVGAVSLGFSPSGTRIRRKVTGRTTAEVRDRLRELHQEVESDLRPRGQRYTVSDALEDWLAYGLDGVSSRTVTLYQGTIAPLLTEQFGAVRLRDLTAGDVQNALTALAFLMSTRTVQISHNVLVRAIRQAEQDGLVARNVAALVKPPKGAACWAPVEVAHAGAGDRLDGCRQGHTAGGVHHCDPARGPADGGGSRAALGSRRRLGRRPVAAGHRGRVRPGAARGVRMALRSRRRRHQDPEVQENAGPAPPVRGGSARAEGPAGRGPARGWIAMAGPQAGIRLHCRHAAR